MKVEQAGLGRGNFVEMAICAIGSKILTFEPNYKNEQFTEIWGLPVSGGMKTHFYEKCSELSTFLIHRQSQDKLKGLIESFSQQVFNSWAEEGMPGSYDEYAASMAAEHYFNNIFRFELMAAESKLWGAYHYVAISVRPPTSSLDEAALKASRKIMEAQSQGIVYCVDPRLVENEQTCLGSSPAEQALPESRQETLPEAVNVKQLKATK